MQKNSFKLQFSERLCELMIQRGYASHNAASGVSPSALCKAIGCFTETALRYLSGRAIPSPETIIKISTWLEVEPGYLLFGTLEKNIEKDKNTLKIDKDFFQYALTQIIPTLKNAKNGGVLDFFISILVDLSQMPIEPEQLKKIFDLTIKSSMFFEKEVFSGKVVHDQDKSKNCIAS